MNVELVWSFCDEKWESCGLKGGRNSSWCPTASHFYSLQRAVQWAEGPDVNKWGLKWLFKNVKDNKKKLKKLRWHAPLRRPLTSARHLPASVKACTVSGFNILSWGKYTCAHCVADADAIYCAALSPSCQRFSLFVYIVAPRIVCVVADYSYLANCATRCFPEWDNSSGPHTYEQLPCHPDSNEGLSLCPIGRLLTYQSVGQQRGKEQR